MASRKSRLKVVRTSTAIDELDEIWKWNAHQYGPAHADRYLSFLTSRIDALSFDYDRGKKVRRRDGIRYILVRKRSRGHGHVVIYSLDNKEVLILHVFHTSQDWQSRA